MYGLYLLVKFNIETKYFKLAKLIHIRRKFKKYNMILNLIFSNWYNINFIVE